MFDEEYYTEELYGEEFDNFELFNEDGRISGFQIGNVVECSRYFGPEWLEEQDDPKGIFLKRGLYGQNGKLFNVFKMLRTGHSNSDISKESGVTQNTVRKYKSVFGKLTGTCGCGGKYNHKHSCLYTESNLPRLKRLFEIGYGNKTIAKKTGHALPAIRKYRKILEDVNQVQYKCPCGKLAVHQGWCEFRIKNSVKKKKLLGWIDE